MLTSEKKYAIVVYIIHKKKRGSVMTNEELYKIVIDKIVSDNPSLEYNLEAKVSKSMLNRIAKEDLTYDYVIQNNEELSEKYYHVVKAYGFENFYDLFYYADSCDSTNEWIEKGGQKDLSRLKRVTRTVMRNGKPMKTTIYEDSASEDSSSNPMDKGASNTEEIAPRNAKDLRMSSIGDIKIGADPKEVAKIKAEAEKLEGTFISGCNAYLVLQGDQNELAGVAGYRVEGKYLYLVFYQADEYTSGVAYQAFYQLLLKAWKAGLGAMLDTTDDPTALALLADYGLVKSGACYKINKQKLQKQLGKP